MNNWNEIKTMVLSGVKVGVAAQLFGVNKATIYRKMREEKVSLRLKIPYEEIVRRVEEGEYNSYTEAAKDFCISRQLLHHHVKRIRNARNNHTP